MNQQEKRLFDLFIKESFNNDVLVRELRLSDAEVVYLQQSFPNAEISCIATTKPQEKRWYKVKLQAAKVPQYV
ncbi:hypothetical protein [Oceanobacillus chungangensis]|uniref:Uncharacterized protein n=1 Tax=Oceanobacillus chungangensis TaxID=1229152 RepID=A0A3D8Q1T1_9BACI|nr:hypothetical protein [Oceanobacillus chungangensis]RDW21531.1 hypothetical protein CWR45_01260 [Oceanobacillus chungangensis]